MSLANLKSIESCAGLLVFLEATHQVFRGSGYQEVGNPQHVGIHVTVVSIIQKGKHQIESEYYVDRVGTYQTGTCVVQCAYSPEFMAREAGQVLVVK